MSSVYSMTSNDWAKYLEDSNESTHTLKYLVGGLLKNRDLWAKHLSNNIVQDIKSSFDFILPTISKIQESTDGTTKFQMRFEDGLEVETVLIPFHKRFTVCLSTQVGCGMNCSFCFTGTQGLKRNLASSEIVGQYVVAKNFLEQKNRDALSPSIVFMGQGEPLHNLAEVKKAVEVLNDPHLYGVGLKQMTLSTVGFLPGIRELKDFPLINLALSLHSPFDEERNKLIPINQKYPLRDVLKVLEELPNRSKKFLTVEYLLISNMNMTSEHALELQKLFAEKKVMLNLIPFNPFPGSSWTRPSSEEIENFRLKLVEEKLRVMVRTTKGDDILAACGQLKIKELARNYAT